MSDKKFWKIMDRYEVNGIIPKDNYDLLIHDVCKENDYDYDESIADMQLCRFKGDKIPAYIPKHVKMLCDYANAA